MSYKHLKLFLKSIGGHLRCGHKLSKVCTVSFNSGGSPTGVPPFLFMRHRV